MQFCLTYSGFSHQFLTTYIVIFTCCTSDIIGYNYNKQIILGHLDLNTCILLLSSATDESGVRSISSVLPVLSKMMDGMNSKSVAQLIPCLRLEKEATGALLLARGEEVVEHILNLHRNIQVQRTFWYSTLWRWLNKDDRLCALIDTMLQWNVLRIVTVGVPVPSEGVIDIPITEKEVTGSQPHYKVRLFLGVFNQLIDSQKAYSKCSNSRRQLASPLNNK